MLVLAFASVVVIGFLVGFFSFRVKSRWCPHCGSTTSCYAPTPTATVHLDR